MSKVDPKKLLRIRDAGDLLQEGKKAKIPPFSAIRFHIEESAGDQDPVAMELMASRSKAVSMARDQPDAHVVGVVDDLQAEKELLTDEESKALRDLRLVKLLASSLREQKGSEGQVDEETLRQSCMRSSRRPTRPRA